MSNGESLERRSGSRDARIEDVIMDVLQRRLAGEPLADEQVTARHPELMPDLADELRLAGELRADSNSDESKHVAQDRGSGMLTVRCPHCRERIELRTDSPITGIRCTGCGRLFSLAPETIEISGAATPDKLGHFELVERWGVGSFGTVWKAYHSELNRMVAVKVPRPGRLAADQIEKFLREARTVAQLNHRNIVAVHESGRVDDTVFIVNDFINGLPLSEWFTRQQATFREVARLCVKVAEALHHAQVQGVTHRDLKPQNIVMDFDDEPRVTNFLGSHVVRPGRPR